MLEIGYNADFEVRKECIELCDAPQFSVLYISDLHLNGYSDTLVNRLTKCIETLDPTIILLGGDYVDTKKGLYYFEKLLHTISHRQNICIIAGNHDYFYDIHTIKNVCAKYAIHWIENHSHWVDIDGFTVQIVGSDPKKYSTQADFNILCLHQPIDITPFHAQFNIVFAGHLHGCQVVFWQNDKGLFPGKWFYTWNILKWHIGNCLYVVSKGLGDTLPLRFNCKKDVILLEIKNHI
jgi:hypothetical protein